MKHLFAWLYLLIIFTQTNSNSIGYVIVPVADLIGNFYSGPDVHAFYDNLPFCYRFSPDDCPRLHQLLYGEQVEILNEVGNQVQIKVPHFFYITTQSSIPQTHYWTLKKNIIKTEDLKKYGYSVSIFPKPINFFFRKIPNENIVVLKSPWLDSKSKKVFSAGTRFIIYNQLLNKNYIEVKIFDPHHKRIRIIHLPKSQCILPYQLKTKEQQINTLISLLKELAHKDIPYTWGGCSYTHPLINKKEKFKKNSPKTGFDCAGLILRLAQICNIPYFFKNTYTIANTLESLKNNQHLEIGDLIWIPGHIMIVSDLKRNLLIEARSYEQGYGKVHEIPLKEQFQNMNTFDQLLEYYHSNTPIKRLNKKGEIITVIKEFKILKLASVWNRKK